MKTLIAYYSRTGITKKLADSIAKEIKCDTEEIFTAKETKGPIGYIACGREAMKKIPAEIKKTKKDTSKYDLVILGGPVWAWNISSPIRAYMIEHKFKKVAFFCTQGGSGAETAFKEMKSLSKKPLATLALKTTEVVKTDYSKQVKGFCNKLKKI